MPHDDDFDEYVGEPDEPAGGRHRLLIIILGVGCVALAVSNIVLATRVAQLRQAGPERIAVARAPVEESAGAAEGQASPPSAGPVSNPPAPAAPAPAAAATPSPAPERAAAPAVIPPPPAPPELPSRPARRVDSRVAATSRTSEHVSPSPGSRERATASWMVQEYGRLDAETRARTAADFYDPQSSERAYWRRVLSEILAERR